LARCFTRHATAGDPDSLARGWIADELLWIAVVD